MRNRETLSPEQDAKPQAALDACSALREVYLLKEEFRTIFEKLHDPERAERFLSAWKKSRLFWPFDSNSEQSVAHVSQSWRPPSCVARAMAGRLTGGHPPIAGSGGAGSCAT